MTFEQADSQGYVFDPESSTEMARLINQERQLTEGMGGVFAGLTDTSSMHNVLDLACGPGGWVLDTAFEHPEIEVAGVDISRIMVDYANARARTQNLTNASFGVMDITQPLDFPDGAFDLVNARFLFAVLRRGSWGSFISECTRLLRPGGILRLTEPVDMGISNSPAGAQINAWLCEALWRAGYSFSEDGRTIGMTPMLPLLLRTAGQQNIQMQAYAVEYSANTERWASGYRNAEVACYQLMPLFVKTGVATQEEVERQYQQLLIEMRAEDYVCMGHYVSVWGQNP